MCRLFLATPGMTSVTCTCTKLHWFRLAQLLLLRLQKVMMDALIMCLTNCRRLQLEPGFPAGMKLSCGAQKA